jgi:hypothetical protein
LWLRRDRVREGEGIGRRGREREDWVDRKRGTRFGFPNLEAWTEL